MEKVIYRNWVGAILATQRSMPAEGTVPEPNTAQEGADFFCQELSAVNSPQELGTFARPGLPCQWKCYTDTLPCLTCSGLATSQMFRALYWEVKGCFQSCSVIQNVDLKACVCSISTRKLGFLRWTSFSFLHWKRLCKWLLITEESYVWVTTECPNYCDGNEKLFTSSHCPLWGPWYHLDTYWLL